MKLRGCRFCGEIIDASNYDVLSSFRHSHPSKCPHRQDRVPSLNGVHVGDLWQNRHTGCVFRITAIRLGGHGTYTDREPSVESEDVWRGREARLAEETEIHQARAQRESYQPTLFGEAPPASTPSLEELQAMPALERAFHRMGNPLWSLVEHNDPLTRPGDYPVPWEERTRWSHPERWVLRAWRGPSYRHPGDPDYDKDGAYWHSFHWISGYCSNSWDWWMFDPDDPERSLAELPPGQLLLPIAS